MHTALHVAWLLLLTLCSAAHAQISEEGAARREFEAGRDAYERGAFGTALEHFERAYALEPKPELLYDAGRAAESDGQAGRAIEAYSSYLRVDPDAPNADFVRARLAKMQALERDRVARPLPTVAQAEQTTPSAPLDVPRRPTWKRAWVWSALGALVVGGVVAGVLLATRERSPERVEADAYALIPETR